LEKAFLFNQENLIREKQKKNSMKKNLQGQKKGLIVVASYLIPLLDQHPSAATMKFGKDKSQKLRKVLEILPKVRANSTLSWLESNPSE